MAIWRVIANPLTILPHPSADKMSLGKLGQFQVVIAKSNGYVDGQIVVFAPEKSILPEDLRPHYTNSETGASYLSGKEHDRVSSIRLRGELSMGVTLPPEWVLAKGGWSSLEDIPLDTDLSEILGITKYEAPIPLGMSGTLARIETTADFQEHDVEQFRLYEKEFKVGEPVIATEKLHGCFQSEVSIYFADGTRDTIGNIVKTKIDKEVWGVNSQNQLVTSKITNWFVNGHSDEWLHIKYERNSFDRGVSHQVIKATPNHHIFDPISKSYKPAKEFVVGDYVLASRNKLSFSYFHTQLLIGKMLGDASYQWQSNRITFGHSKKQEEYLDFCLENLDGFVSKGKEQVSGYGSAMVRASTLSNPAFQEIFHEWIVDGKKCVPKSIIGNLSPISLAFWYMDDGSLSTHKNQEDRIMLATCGFDEESVDNLVSSLKVMGLESKKCRYSNYWRISLNSDNSDKFFVLIRPYVPECMQYKLPVYYRGSKVCLSLENKSSYKQSLKPAKITSIEKLNINRKKYDIETATHNYFAGGILVHNSQISILRDESGQCLVTSKGIASRHCSILEDESNIYWKAVRNVGLFETLSLVPDVNFQIFGEVIPCQGEYTYGQEKFKPTLRIFRLIVDGSEYSYKFILTEKTFLDKLTPVLDTLVNLWVPVIYDGPFDVEKLIEASKGKETVSKKELHIREGVVVTPTAPRLSSEGFPLIVKIINPKYRESGEEFS